MAFAALSSAQSPDSFNPGANNAVYATAIQSDGRILVGGRFTTIGGAARPGLARLTAEGALEAGFKPLVTNGVPRSSAGIIGIAVQPDNRIVVVGEFSILNGQLCGGIGERNCGGREGRGRVRQLGGPSGQSECVSGGYGYE